MRRISISLSAAILAGALATPAYAQETGADDAPGWSVTITPRYQKLFFDPGGDDLENMDNLGGSITLRNPDQRFGLTAMYFGGTGKGNYDFSPTLNYRYKLKRREFAFTGEITPRETGVTFLGGLRHFNVRQNEFLTNPGPGNSEVNNYRFKLTVAEFGVRLASRLGANSRHSISAQFSGGIGGGRARVNENEVFGGFVNSNVSNDKGTAYYGEAALGYNVFLTDNISLGARARGYVFDIDATGGDTVFALAPELNFSVRF